MTKTTERAVGEDEELDGGEGPRPGAFAKAFGDALRDSGISQSELSGRSGVAQPTLSQWKNGHITPETPETVFAVERALGVPPGFLSQHLGYVPVEAAGENWLAGLLRNPDIDDRVRRLLEVIVREFGGQSEAGGEGS